MPAYALNFDNETWIIDFALPVFAQYASQSFDHLSLSNTGFAGSSTSSHNRDILFLML